MNGPSTIQLTYQDSDTVTYLTPLVSSVTWSGDVSNSVRKIDVSMLNTVDGRTQNIDIKLGRQVTFFHNSVELFRGTVFTKEIGSEGALSFTAYDANYYLTKNKATKKWANRKASDIIIELCREFGIPCGSIPNTSYVFPKLIFRDKTLWDMMITVLTETTKKTGKRYFLSNKNGKLEVFLRTEQVTQFVIERGGYLTSSVYSQSIEDTITQVQVVGGENKELTVTRKNGGLIAEYGIMQHSEENTEMTSIAELTTLADRLLAEKGVVEDEAAIEALGIPSVIAGSAVYALDSMTKISGSYYVQTDSHSFSQGKHTMSLTLSRTDELPELDYEDPDESSSSSNSSKPYLTNLPALATSGVKRTYKSDRAYELAKKHGCRLTSAYRTAAHNASIGGSKTSQHVQGTAYDFAGTMAQMDSLCSALLKEGGYRQIIWRNKIQPNGGYVSGHMDHVHVGW